jgi:hypothetical protein
MTRRYPPRQCKNPKCRFGGDGQPKLFVPERKWQRFCSTVCRHQSHGPGMIYVPVAMRNGGPSRASRDAVSARRPRIATRVLCWQRGAKFAVTDKGKGTRETGRPVLRVDTHGVVSSFRLLAQRRRVAEWQPNHRLQPS